uniref:GST C-terminal domain-containing protein n=2 Tax=Lotharella oceanica TaxID=641309 RepID=A0A7S2U3R2_9EUKA|mmetsp:Transcript_8824/g.17278  ORF Transcript_8824/g.17278 Transcript_8824/m.17278 type:complete len:220 (+) Transcript_8824:41-700(+)
MFQDVAVCFSPGEESIIMTEEKGEYKLYYWRACEKFWGRAIGPVLTLDHAEANFTVDEPSKAPTGVGFAFPQITLPSGKSMAQTPAMLIVLGDIFGLSGKTEDEKMYCKQMIMDVNDICSEAMGGKWKEKPERADKWLTLLEAKLKKTKFLVCDTPTVADFHAVFAFEWVNKKYSPAATQSGEDSTKAKKFENVRRWWDDMNKLAAVKKMRTSGVPMIP